ncbi:MAG: hypothetical protein JO249_19690 [Acidobacteria bacterium]|nr:hypothetical protein [Acidobacteriota bacterium]
MAVQNPSAHRAVIAFAAWSSLAHAVTMSILRVEITRQRVGFLFGSAVLVIIGMILLALAPTERSQKAAIYPGAVGLLDSKQKSEWLTSAAQLPESQGCIGTVG